MLRGMDKSGNYVELSVGQQKAYKEQFKKKQRADKEARLNKAKEDAPIKISQSQTGTLQEGGQEAGEGKTVEAPEVQAPPTEREVLKGKLEAAGVPFAKNATMAILKGLVAKLEAADNTDL